MTNSFIRSSGIFKDSILEMLNGISPTLMPNSTDKENHNTTKELSHPVYQKMIETLGNTVSGTNMIISIVGEWSHSRDIKSLRTKLMTSWDNEIRTNAQSSFEAIGRKET